MTTDEIRQESVDEVTEILNSYDVWEHDSEKILELMEKPYVLLEQAYKVGKQMESFIRDELGQSGYEKFIRIITGREEPGKELEKEL